MKICPKCGETKGTEAFYKGNAYCKPCQKEYTRLYKMTEKGKAIRRHQYARHRVYHQEYSRNQRLKEPCKMMAERLLNKAVRGGMIIKPGECQECSRADCKIYGHHKTYAEPLDVIWLCGTCHYKVHQYRQVKSVVVE